MSGLFGSKRKQAADMAEIGRLLDAPITFDGLLDGPNEPISEASHRKLRSMGNKAAWRARASRVDRDEDDDG